MADETTRTRRFGKTRAATFAALIVGALLAVFTLTTCAGTGGVSSDSGSWTICLYLCGSNLESRQSWGTKTLDEICGAKIPANATVVIQAGGAKEWHNDHVATNGTRFVVEDHELVNVGTAGTASTEGDAGAAGTASSTGGAGTASSTGGAGTAGTAGDACMGDASTLADFLIFCVQEYPADHMAVVLWDHGGGPLKGACYDETHRFNALTLAELDEAIGQGVQSRGGKPYDIVGFDACLMASLETASMLSDDAQLLVVSEEIEAGAGWDYTALFTALKKTPAARDVAAAICDGYLEKCAARDKDAAATLSVIDLSQVAGVEEALDVAIAELEGSKETEVQALRHLAFGTRYAESFGGSTKEEGRSNLVDLKAMAEGNVEGSADGGEAWKAVAQAVDDAVAYNVHGSITAGANGLSIWYPQSFDKDDFDRYVKVSPLTSYAHKLSELYGGSMGEVGFSDAGSITDEGRLSVTIDPATSDEFFDLYVVNGAVDGSYQDTNVDIYED